MEDLNDILYDDAEAKYLELQNKKKKRKKRQRKIKLITVFVILACGILYFSSDMSKVKSLTVSGNHFYSDEEILNKAGLSYNTRYILNPKFFIEWKLNQSDLIDSVEVTKEMDGRISIQVNEKIIIGYLIEDDKNYVLTNENKKYEIQSTNLSTIVNYPLIDGFLEEELANLAASFKNKNTTVSDDIIRMISEIRPYESSYDKNMVKIVMQDGNKIYTSYDSLFLLNTYKLALKELKSTHVCMFMDSLTNAIATQSCDDFEKAVEEKKEEETKSETPTDNQENQTSQTTTEETTPQQSEEYTNNEENQSSDQESQDTQADNSEESQSE